MKKSFILSIMTLVLCACTDDTATRPEQQEMWVGFADDTRVQLNEKYKTVWNSGDMISVFNKNDANSCWRYQGADMAQEGPIFMVSSPATQTTTFANIYGIYPYNANYAINMFGEISLSVPAEQMWTAGSYGVGDNIMVAVGEDDNLSFKNIFGWLKLQFTGTDAISQITLRGNNEEPLTGIVTYDPYVMEASFSESAGKEITLHCPEVALDADRAQAFYLAIAPQLFEKGFSIEVKNIDGKIFKESLNSRFEIKRNTIHTMAALEAIFPSEPSPANNKIWYTTKTTGQRVNYYSGSSNGNAGEITLFGAKIVSNVVNGNKGIISFDGDVTLIGTAAFMGNSNIVSITLPESVASINSNAFAECPNLEAFYGKFASTDNRCLIIDNTLRMFAPAGLTNYTTPAGITAIRNSAFFGCTKLTSVTISNGVKSIDGAAFAQCKGLRTVTIPNSVETIGSSAFAQCSLLTSITLPESVSSIGSFAFMDCTAITKLYCKAVNPPKLGSYMLYNNHNNPIIYVPTESVTAYKSANSWKEFSSYIRGYNF